MKLGTKVKCKGYLKKIKGLDYVYANKTHFDRNNQEGMLEEPNFYIEDECEYKQKTMEIKEKEFNGIVVAKKYVSTENYYTQASESIYDEVTFGYVDERYLNAVNVEKDGYMECYQVFYAMGKSRIVPVDYAKEEI